MLSGKAVIIASPYIPKWEIGFRAVRVRCYGDLARIEVDRGDRNKLFNEDILDAISHKLKEFGFKYITLDMEGYRTGSFNAAIGK
ncbi:MAG: pyridinium-3,5-biscarboxylic acid mononucleotide sulfurtransferase [Candidatus Petromonas sp.]|jgi:uncharacterized protein|nr:pyridinium-3,5-biscarboxylic acid mononucleotide sulfurtransferase [Candidatus Petromonas sp.]